jgi:hypothetical protein
MKLEFLDIFSKNIEIQIPLKIRLLGADFFNVDGQTDRHNEAINRFTQFLRTLTKRGQSRWFS